MDRRSFLKTMTAASASVGVAAATSALAQDATRKPRQVVVILGESVRQDMLNCYRNTGLKTPHLDRIAAEGVRFDRAYDCQPVCSPARSAVWTGLYPHTNGMWGNSMELGDATHTIGQRLHDRGIDTALIGKWHLDGFDYFGNGRPAPGWDPKYWYDMRTYLMELTPEDRVRSRNPDTAKTENWPAEKTYAHRCATRAVDFLTEKTNQDFMLAVCFDEPHGPSLCPPQYISMYENFVFPGNVNETDSLAHKPEEQRVWADGRIGQPPHPIKDAQFFGSHTFVDDQIGRILDAIDQHAPDALVIFTSDHGVFLNSHHLTDKGAAMYDEITRIPFLVRWPGHAPKNVSSPSLVSHIDLSATLMDFFGFEIPKTLEGNTSMLPLFKDPVTPVRKEVFIEWSRYEVDHDGFGGYQPIRCIVDGRYKLSIHVMTTDELYDLQADPSEMNNLIDSPAHAALRNALHDKLLAQMNDTRDPFRGYYWGRRAWRPDFPVSWDNAGMTRQRETDGYLPRQLDYDTGLPMKSATRPKSKPRSKPSSRPTGA
jgi:uncharacterized sulfatase